MADNIFVIDDDYKHEFLSDTIVTAGFSLKADIRWGDSLYALNKMIDQHGNPRFLVLDNNLDDGQGIQWIGKALQEGRISPDTIIAAISSSNATLVFQEHKNLNNRGIGAFLKPHVAEMCLWMALRDSNLKRGKSPIPSQYEVYDVNKVDQTFYSKFGMNIYQSIYPQNYLKELHNAGRNWSYASGDLIVGEAKTVGVFQKMLSSGLQPKDILDMTSDRLKETFNQIRNEGNGGNPERGK